MQFDEMSTAVPMSTTSPGYNLDPISYEDYNQDFNESDININFEPRVISKNQILFTTLIYTVTFCVGFFGNLLVLLVIFKIKKLHNFTNLFLFSLALADIILISVCVPFKVKISF